MLIAYHDIRNQPSNVQLYMSCCSIDMERAYIKIKQNINKQHIAK